MVARRCNSLIAVSRRFNFCFEENYTTIQFGLTAAKPTPISRLQRSPHFLEDRMVDGGARSGVRDWGCRRAGRRQSHSGCTELGVGLVVLHRRASFASDEA